MWSSCRACRPWRRSQRRWLRADLGAELSTPLKWEESRRRPYGTGLPGTAPLLNFGILLQASCYVCGEGGLPVGIVAHAEEALKHIQLPIHPCGKQFLMPAVGWARPKDA